MKQYTDEIQTAKLIELGFEEPKTVVARKDYGVLQEELDTLYKEINEL